MRYYRVLGISLALHLILALLLTKFVPVLAMPKPAPTYVDLMEKPELSKRPHQEPRNEKEFVRQVQVPKNMLTTKKNDARFASEEEQNVLEEQKARLNDMTSNRSMQGQKNAQPVPQQKKVGKSGKIVRKDLDLNPTTPLEVAKQRLLRGIDHMPNGGDVNVGGVTPKAQRQAAGENGEDGKPMAPSFGGLDKGFSTLGEQLPDDVKFGDFTALNTDRHLFYSFYARMEEKIRYRWVTYARAAVYNIPASVMKSQGKEQYITQLEVILDASGHYQRSILHSSSGMQSLDEAPVQAFKEAGEFPNPPPEMVKSDGFIHIYYAFNVNMSPGLAGN